MQRQMQRLPPGMAVRLLALVAPAPGPPPALPILCQGHPLTLSQRGLQGPGWERQREKRKDKKSGGGGRAGAKAAVVGREGRRLGSGLK